MKTVKEVSELLDVSKQTIHYHLKSLPSNLKVNKVGNKSLIDDNTIDYLKTILNKKTTKESTKFDEKQIREQFGCLIFFSFLLLSPNFDLHLYDYN